MGVPLHITAKLKKHASNIGMKISGTLVAVNAAGITFKAYSAVAASASSSVETAGVYAFTLPAYGPDDGAAPNLVDSAGAQNINTLIAGTGGNDIVLSGSTTYFCTSSISIPSGKTLRAATGSSVTLKRSSAFTGAIIVMTGCVNSAIKNITIDGNYSQHSANEGGSGVHGIEIQNGSANTVEHCELINHPSYGIWVFNSNRLTVQYNQFTEIWQPMRIDGNDISGTAATIWGNNFLNTTAFKSIQGIEAINTDSLQIWHNTMAGFGVNEATSHGFEGTWGNCLYLWKNRNLHVENNTLNQAYWSGLVVGQSSVNATVIHNEIHYGTQSGSAGTGGSRSFWNEQAGADGLSFFWNYCVGGFFIGDGGGNNANITANVIEAYNSVGMDISFSCLSATIENNTITRIAGSVNGVLMWNKTASSCAIVFRNNLVNGNFNYGVEVNNDGATGAVHGITIQGNTFSVSVSAVTKGANVSFGPSCSIQSG